MLNLKHCREAGGKTGTHARTMEECLAFTEMLFRVALRMTRSAQAAEALTLRTMEDVVGERAGTCAPRCLKSRLLTRLRCNFVHGVACDS